MKWWPWGRRRETRAAASGFTAEIMAARESYISGRRGHGELSATVQSCIALWEGGLAMADVEGTALLTPDVLALTARAAALRGEAVFLIRAELVPCADWEVRTRDGRPTAYRVSVSEAGGGRSETVLAGEVLHLRLGADIVAPWTGTAPLRRASLTAAVLHAVEDALRDVYEMAPLGSQIVPFPEAPETERDQLGREFRGKRGRILLRESVTTAAAGGPTPSADWRPADVTPDLSRAMTKETLEAARDAIAAAFGVLPGMLNRSTTGPMVREAQRHLAQWTLMPIARRLSAEASEKLGTPVSIDVMRPLQAYDAGGRARAVVAIVNALAKAKEDGVDAADVARTLNLMDWKTAEGEPS
ncbi:MAG: phage portal protein [Pseudomonadota bacterium]